MKASRRDSGQAAVEAALTLPLTLFLLLGIMQLFQILQARVLAEYAVFRAVRVGTTNSAKCRPMMDAAVLVLLPSFRTFMKNGTPATDLAAEFRKHSSVNGYRYDDDYTDGGNALHLSGSILMLTKEFTKAVDPALEQEFDQPGPPQRLSGTLVFWYPMRIPFANWVISKMVLGYAAVNPLMPAQNAKGWTGVGMGGYAGTVAARAANGEYVLPVVARYSMRMQSPVLDAGNTCGGS